MVLIEFVVLIVVQHAVKIVIWATAVVASIVVVGMVLNGFVDKNVEGVADMCQLVNVV